MKPKSFVSTFVFLTYELCSLCTHRMEKSHSKAEARVSTKSCPKSVAIRRPVQLYWPLNEHQQVPVHLGVCFYVSPRLWRSAQGFQHIGAQYQESEAETLRDRGRGYTVAAGHGESHALHDKGKSLCHSSHRRPGGKSWE